MNNTTPDTNVPPRQPPPSETETSVDRQLRLLEKWTNIYRGFVALFGLAVFGLAFYVTVIPQAANTEISKSFPILVGAIVSLVSTISGYYFGSSVGSNNKDDTIRNALRTAQEEGPSGRGAPP